MGHRKYSGQISRSLNRIGLVTKRTFAIKSVVTITVGRTGLTACHRTKAPFSWAHQPLLHDPVAACTGPHASPRRQASNTRPPTTGLRLRPKCQASTPGTCRCWEVRSVARGEGSVARGAAQR